MCKRSINTAAFTLAHYERKQAMTTEKNLKLISQITNADITPKILLQNGARLTISVKQKDQEFILMDVAASSEPSEDGDMLDFLIACTLTPCVRKIEE